LLVSGLTFKKIGGLNTTTVDMLLYLIRRQSLDILDIPIAEITRQYLDLGETPPRVGASTPYSPGRAEDRP
jgi:hypothetical protein